MTVALDVQARPCTCQGLIDRAGSSITPPLQ
jgi:hypothetical protein